MTTATRSLSDTLPAPSSTLRPEEPVAPVESDLLLGRAVGFGAAGAVARSAGDEGTADDCYDAALEDVRATIQRLGTDAAIATRLSVLRAGITLALDGGRVEIARAFLAEAYAVAPETRVNEDWAELRDMRAWPDVWLVAAVRRNPPDEPALQALADRYWKTLFARCRVLTLDHHKAHDLAQEAWCRVLRARCTLRPGGNFPGYLTTVATNIWRDGNRSARRAGVMAEHRLVSLDAEWVGDDGSTVALGDALADLDALAGEERRQLLLEIDDAMGQLRPLFREMLVARFLAGESCAEIGRRHHRTEQTISGWVRQAVRELRQTLAGTLVDASQTAES